MKCGMKISGSWCPETTNLDVSIGNQKNIDKAYKYEIPKKYNMYLQ